MKVLGIDIGGTKSGVLLAETSGANVTFIDKRTFATDHVGGSMAMIEKFAAEAADLLRVNSLTTADVSAAGINCGGPLDSRRGMILCPPNLPGWVNIPVVDLLTEKLGIRCFLQNDANAGALAEFLFGAGRGCQNLMFLTFGTGMGAGLVLNGRLYAGTNDMAGEVGHIRMAPFGPVGFGKAGSFEGFCSGGGLAQLARTKALERLQMGSSTMYCETLAALDGVTAQTVAEAARAGDETALSVFAVCGAQLGAALSLFIDILNPEKILIGSIYGKCEDLLADAVRAVIQREAIPFASAVCSVEPCGLGDQINDYEAVAIAVDGLR